MKPLKFVQLCAALACFVQFSPAMATPVFMPGYNQLFMSNFMNLYRANVNCTGGGCILADANDPTGYQRVDITLPSNSMVGDILLGIFNVNRIENPAGTVNWTGSPADQFSGYFAAQFISILPANGDPSGMNHVTLGSAVDPFGILGSGEVFTFRNSGGPFNPNGSLVASAASALGGVLWANFGLGSNGFGYIHQSISGLATNAFFALNALSRGPAYNAGVLASINDPTESEVGGVSTSPGGLCTGPAICSDLVASSNIVANPAFPGTSGWMLRNESSFALFSVPEPSSLALVGICLVGLGFSKRRASALSPKFHR